MPRVRVVLPVVAAFLAMVAAGLGIASPAAADDVVDVELVLAVDVSYSMDLDELALQRDGYVGAVTSPEFLNALKLGPNGKVALAYVEWAGAEDQKLVVDWTEVGNEEEARAFAAAIRNAPLRRVYRTSISGAMNFSAELIRNNRFAGLKRVIDISGDGTNNQGPLVDATRDEVVKQGITINGLPLMMKEPAGSMLDIGQLDVYYEDCVIGGPGAFVVPVRGMHEFATAIKTKLVLEIAGLRLPPPRIGPAPEVHPVAGDKRVSCSIGERMWMERWGN
ncbi:DUF1194 domain-containing protein [Ancylobacter defluvii]|uniref:DUF1194 domain-containing protein n=1 Tax=Ancylobacter defluvii TaxID=1282440 RepID=A0A9W6NC76_9HYPH|nr:DUF1194 domain-containing protein [Ancylobacter defluvii]MBS7589652.1 DUF1194 domain-containing protein [Ancylobacter defluvii]GLK85271.1 hypothetical protein GCM10017653_33410 [Ancylobacter defluvii]